MFERTGLCSKRRAHIRNDGVVFQKDRLTFKRMGSHLKGRARV